MILVRNRFFFCLWFPCVATYDGQTFICNQTLIFRVWPHVQSIEKQNAVARFQSTFLSRTVCGEQAKVSENITGWEWSSATMSAANKLRRTQEVRRVRLWLMLSICAWHATKATDRWNDDDDDDEADYVRKQCCQNKFSADQWRLQWNHPPPSPPHPSTFSHREGDVSIFFKVWIYAFCVCVCVCPEGYILVYIYSHFS